MAEAPNGEVLGQSTTPLEDANFIVFTKNIRSLALQNGNKLNELLAELESIDWDVILLSEVRTPSQQLVVEGGHMLYTTLGDNNCSGTSILFHAKHVKKNNKIHEVSDRVFALDLGVN